MRRSLLLMCALSVTATSGCDRARKQAATIGATIGASIRAKVELARQRFLHKPPPPAPAPALPPSPAPAATPAAPALAAPPAAVRTRGDFTYLYFKNGCEYSCGHLDVVTLQHGQVVDAIVRWPGHGYSGESSSPASVVPHGPPHGGDTLRVRRDPT